MEVIVGGIFSHVIHHSGMRRVVRMVIGVAVQVIIDGRRHQSEPEHSPRFRTKLLPNIGNMQQVIPSQDANGSLPVKVLPRRRTGKALRWFCFAIGVLIVALGIAWGAARWRERPLAEAEHAWSAGDYERAVGLADYFLDSHPGHGGALAVKGRALTRLGRPREAVECFELSGAADVRDTHLWAEALLSLELFSGAMPLLLRVCELEPHNANALYELTVCRMRLQMFREALASAAEFTALPNCEARGRLLIATIQHDLHNYDSAAKECHRVLELEPDGEHLQLARHEMFIFYGRTLLQAGRPREALPILGRSILLQPTAEAYALLGDAADQVGESARAVSFWQSALKSEPDNVTAREALANAAMTNQDGKLALEWLAPLKTRPDLRASTAYLVQRASLLLKDEAAATAWQARTEALRKHERLMGTINRVVTDSPNSFWAWVIQAYRFAEAGNWEQADAIFRTIAREEIRDDFVRELAAAVQNRSALPPLDQFPVKEH